MKQIRIGVNKMDCDVAGNKKKCYDGSETPEQKDENENKKWRDMEYEVNNMVPGVIMTIIRYAIIIGIYVGFTCVIWSIFTNEHPKGPQYTPPISVTMQCVINLTVQFFTVYLGLWIAQTVKDFIGWDLSKLSDLMEDANGTIQTP